jgi:hypothetical protein
MTRYRRSFPIRADGGSSDRERARERDRVLRTLQREAEQYPATSSARGVPSEEFRELEVALDPLILGRDVDRATLRIVWRPSNAPASDERAEFVFHYSEPTGYNCGWHREPNPHVEGWTHFQERLPGESTPEYGMARFGTESPVGIFWEVVSRLDSHLETDTA